MEVGAKEKETGGGFVGGFAGTKGEAVASREGIEAATEVENGGGVGTGVEKVVEGIDVEVPNAVKDGAGPAARG